MARPLRYLFLMILLALSSQIASAQVTTGTPPFGSFGGGPDVINLANLNSHIAIPVRNKAGRGLNFTYDLSYDSSVWYPIGSSGSQSWQPVGNWGWRGATEAATGYTSASSTNVTCYQCNPYTCWTATGEVIVSNWAYHDAWGVPHPFSGEADLYTGACPNMPGPSTGFTSTATDGSGYTLTVAVSGSNISSAIVTGSDGKVLNGPYNSSSGAGSGTDRNGNQITVSSNGVFTDTLGTTALTVAGSGTPISPLTFTYVAPSGVNAAFTMNYSAYNVKTNFGCSGINEYPANGVSLVSSITLPDNSSYSFTYEQTPGFSGYVTGRLASVTLPTGGTISYSYSGGNNGITCADGTTATLTRTTPDGAWTYAHTESGTAWTTTVTDPQNNQTAIQFQGIYETQRQVYQGSTSGTLLQTVNTCYNGSAIPCTTTAVTLPITQKTVIPQFGSTGLQCKHFYSYSNYGVLTEADDYDYGSGAPGALLKKTLITYASLVNINAFQQQITVQNGSGTTVAQTQYNYDETTPATSSGTPQHVSVSGSRGNLTSVISYSVPGGAHLTKTFTYYDTGNVETFTDVNGGQTTYTYGACGNSFPTSISEPLSLSRSMTWDSTCTGGVLTQVTDENGKATSTTYNDASFWRPASITDPTGAVTNFSYPTASPYNWAESTMTFNSGNSIADMRTTVDGLGRIHLQQKKQGPNATNYDSVETDYDSIGRVSRVTLPYSGTAGQTNGGAPGRTFSYDPLNRILTANDSGNGSTSYSYPQNDVYVTLGPAPTGESAKSRQLEYNSIGRLTSVCEVTAASLSGACGQTNSATGYLTKYTLDAMGNITGVTQNAQPNGTAQTRSYSYDSLSRLTSEANPESGTTTYTYDSVSGCAGTYSSDLVKRYDNAGNTTCYTYDALHRKLSATYPSGTYSSVTPSKYFVYDSASVNGTAMVNVKGRLAEAYTCSTCPGTKITDLGLSYTARGEVSDTYESTPHSSGYYHLTQTYWPHGAANQLSGLSGLPTITFGGTIGSTSGVDGEGRITQVTANTGQNPVTSTTFNLYGTPPTITVTFGSGDSDLFTYDAYTLRKIQYKYSIGSPAQSVVGNLTWNANSTLQKLVITDPFNSPNNQTCNYSYDDLRRLTSGNCGSVESQTFGYDPFGNLTKTGNPGQSFQPVYKDPNTGQTTNKYVSIPGTTVQYDGNGNVMSDGSHTYAWDADGKSVTADGAGLTFDALDRMVEQNRSGTYTQIVYAPRGQKLALMNGQSLVKAFVLLPGGATAVYGSAGLDHYRHSDWLGSSRFSSTPSRTMYSDVAYAPFGETYAQAGTADPSFTEENSDTAVGLYDFPDREYGTQGRWPSPDPAGLAAADLGNPQSWNRYAYVLGDPLDNIDPTGDDTITISYSPCGSYLAMGASPALPCYVGGGYGGYGGLGVFGGGFGGGGSGFLPGEVPTWGDIWSELPPWVLPPLPGDWESLVTVILGPQDPSKLIIQDWTPSECSDVDWPFSSGCAAGVYKAWRESDRSVKDISDKYLKKFGSIGSCFGEFSQVNYYATQNEQIDEALLKGQAALLVVQLLGRSIPGEGMAMEPAEAIAVNIRQQNLNTINEALQGCR